MKIYSRYIIFYLIKIFLLSVVVLTGILTSVRLLSFINQNTIGGVASIEMAIKFITLSAPHLLMYITPIALLCTIIYVYYNLTIDNELITLEAVGLSKINISKPAVLFSVIITIICFTLTTFIVPIAKRELHSYTDLLKGSSKITSILEEKAFNKISKNITLYMETKLEDGFLQGVAIYDKTPSNEYTVLLAEKAKLIPINDSFSFKLYDGSRHSMKDGNMQILYFKTLSFNLPRHKMQETKIDDLDIEELTLLDLLSSNYKRKDLMNERYSELHKRFSWPILNLTIAFIVMCSILSSHFERKWNANKIINAALFSMINLGLVIALRGKVNNGAMYIIALYTLPIFIILVTTHILYQVSNNKRVIPEKFYKKLPKTLQRLFSQ
ncbi:MAG: LptF/LptG family permease [Alphaproteobacteria bacterium]|nr:LptF/LptG family permease [Alphaproteobacteria bacterium]